MQIRDYNNITKETNHLWHVNHENMQKHNKKSKRGRLTLQGIGLITLRSCLSDYYVDSCWLKAAGDLFKMDWMLQNNSWMQKMQV